jgi:outer membrane murein-binding lipoprotein Lpp
MFGKNDLVDSISRDLARARDKRDALASGVTTLTAQIAELEGRLSAENDRRERERAAGEIERIKKQVRDNYLAFAPVIGGIRDATEVAAAIVPDAREFNDLLLVIATEVANAIDGLLGDLDRRIEALRAGHVAPQLLPPRNTSPPALPQNNDRVLRLPEWLPRKKPTKKESAEERCSTAAA